MSFSLADTKREARRALHDLMSVEATYKDPTLAVPADIHVRWHNKLSLTSDGTVGSAEIIAAVDRLVFDRTELVAAGITPVRGARVVIASYDDASFRLDTRDPADGPHTVTWYVTRDREAA